MEVENKKQTFCDSVVDFFSPSEEPAESEEEKSLDEVENIRSKVKYIDVFDNTDIEYELMGMM